MTMPPGPMPPIRPEYTQPSLAAAKSLRGLAIATAILLGVAAAASAIAATTFLERAAAMDAVSDEGASSAMIGMLRGADSGVVGWVLITAVLTLATGTVLIVWQYLYAENAQLLGGPIRWGSGWAIGGWFIPVGNLVLPFMQLSQAAAASDPGSSDEDSSQPKALASWMYTFLLAFVLHAGAVWLRPDTDTRPVDVSSAMSRFAMADWIAAAAMVLYAAAGVFAILTVVTLTRRQRRVIAGRRAT